MDTLLVCVYDSLKKLNDQYDKPDFPNPGFHPLQLLSFGPDEAHYGHYIICEGAHDTLLAPSAYPIAIRTDTPKGQTWASYFKRFSLSPPYPTEADEVIVIVFGKYMHKKFLRLNAAADEHIAAHPDKAIQKWLLSVDEVVAGES